MQVSEVMSIDPVCAPPLADLKTVAQLMVDYDCGEIPICDDDGHLVGVVTDRDIVCRLVARGEDLSEHTVEDCMTRSVVTASPETSVDEAAHLMETHQVRRLPIIDDEGICCGILSQADLAMNTEPTLTGEVVKKVSEPHRTPVI